MNGEWMLALVLIPSTGRESSLCLQRWHQAGACSSARHATLCTLWAYPSERFLVRDLPKQSRGSTTCHWPESTLLLAALRKHPTSDANCWNITLVITKHHMTPPSTVKSLFQILKEQGSDRKNLALINYALTDTKIGFLSVESYRLESYIYGRNIGTFCNKDRCVTR